MTCRGGACPVPHEGVLPIYGIDRGKKRGNATYYYLVESARVDGKPRIVSQEYLGTAGELAAAMRGGGLGLPDRTGHKESRSRRGVGRAGGSRRGRHYR